MTEPRLHLGDEPVLTDDEVREMLRAHLRSRYKTRRVAAAAWGVSRPFISQMLGGQISPLSITAEGLAQLGFRPAVTEGAAKLYAVADMPRIVDALVHVLRGATARGVVNG